MSEAMRRTTIEQKLRKVSNCLQRLSIVIESNKKQSQHAMNQLLSYNHDSSGDEKQLNQTQSLMERQRTIVEQNAINNFQSSQSQFQKIKKKQKKQIKVAPTFFEQRSTQKKLSYKKIQKEPHKSARKMIKTPSQIKSNQFSCLNLSPTCFSPTNMSNQRAIVSRIKKLKTKKNLCDIESAYLQASMKVTQSEISNALLLMKSYSQQSVLNTFMVRTMVKFLSQFQKDICGNGQGFLINVLSHPQKLMNTINRLPQVIRQHEALSEKRCKELFMAKKHVCMQIKLMNKAYFADNALYVYIVHLHNYVEFLLNHNIIHQTKRNKLFSCGECTARSHQKINQKPHQHLIKDNHKKNYREMSHRKVNQYDSQRKNHSAVNKNCKVGKLKKTKIK